MHNTLPISRAHQFTRILALTAVLAALLLNAMPAHGEPSFIDEGDPLTFPTPAASPTSTPNYDPPRNPWPATATPAPAIAATPTPGDLRPVVEHTAKPENLGLLLYIVVSGDTVSGIADTFGLKPDSIIWTNPELQSNPASLKVGQELWIPPLDGAVHTVVSGDTLLGIAGDYGVEMDDITGCFYNSMEDIARLQIGDRLLIPGARRGPSPSLGGVVKTQIRYAARPTSDAPTGTGALTWPVAGRISQGYLAGHRAIDIQGWTGLKIAAADTGFVVECGWDNSGYGNVIVIDHGGGVLTRYAHLNTMSVQAGDAVKQGDVIGEMGSTGRSTGPHLHFEVIINGYQKNPVEYLP